MKNYVTSLGIALSLALAHAAQAQVITPPVPTNIEVSDQALLLDTLSKTTFIQRGAVSSARISLLRVTSSVWCS